MPDQTWAYIARTTRADHHHSEGTIVAAIIDRPELAKSVASALAEWITDECAIERVPLKWAGMNLYTTNRWEPGDVT